MQSDLVEGPEADVFDAMINWVKADEARRKAELDRLLPLVRFAMMEKSAVVMMTEPMVAQHALVGHLIFETHPQFAELAQMATCPRLRPRNGKRLAGLHDRLAFTSASTTAYDISCEGGALLRGTVDMQSGVDHRPAVCAGHKMRAGRHAADFTIVQSFGAGLTPFIGLVWPGIDVEKHAMALKQKFWGVYHGDGELFHASVLQSFSRWHGREGFGSGDVVGLLLDCDASTLTVKKNGMRLGLVAIGLAGVVC
jgi:hypothetical protein